MPPSGSLYVAQIGDAVKKRGVEHPGKLMPYLEALKPYGYELFKSNALMIRDVNIQDIREPGREPAPAAVLLPMPNLPPAPKPKPKPKPKLVPKPKPAPIESAPTPKFASVPVYAPVSSMMNPLRSSTSLLFATAFSSSSSVDAHHALGSQDMPAGPPRLEEQLEQLQLKDGEKTSRASMAQLKTFLMPPGTLGAAADKTRSCLFSGDDLHHIKQYGLLGSDKEQEQQEQGEEAFTYLNTGSPFCMVAVGVQGAGKSHSLGVVLENSLLHCVPFMYASPPSSTIVFHYDQNPSTFCEAVTLSSHSPRAPAESPVVEKMLIFVSPSYYIQRRDYYAGRPNCTVLPLLFCWRQLSADFIKSLMRVETESESVPLYMSLVLNILRGHQKAGSLPDYATFERELDALDLLPGQRAPLDQRRLILRFLVAESAENAKIYQRGMDIGSVLAKNPETGRLIMVDLTDPMITGVDANGIFQVVLKMFMSFHTSLHKLAVFDEAHKYLSGTDELSRTIVTIFRQMRHQGISVAISTQSPRTVPAELFELVSFALIHRFHSLDWFTYLRGKLNLNDEDFERIMDLPTGEALVFSLGWSDGIKKYVRHLRIRQRLTADGGVSKVAHN